MLPNTSQGYIEATANRTARPPAVNRTYQALEELERREKSITRGY